MSVETFVLQDMVTEFHRKFGHPVGLYEQELPQERVVLRVAMIDSEITEGVKAFQLGDIVDVYDAVLDTMYLFIGWAVEGGYNYVPVINLVLDELGDLTKPSLYSLSNVGRFCMRLKPGFQERKPAPRIPTEDVMRSWVNDIRLDLHLLSQFAIRGEVTNCYDQVFNAIARCSEFLIRMGVPVVEGFKIVQESNMSKLGEDGNPIYSRGYEQDGEPLGKILKGPNYFKPEEKLAELIGL